MVTVKKLFRIFDRNTKIILVFMLIAIIIGGLIETLSIAVMLPFIDLLLGNMLVEADSYIGWVYNLFNFSSEKAFHAFFAFLLAAIHIFRGLYLYFLERSKIRFSTYREAHYSKLLLTKLLGFSYLYHTHKNIAEIQRIINEDVNKMFAMISNVLIFLADFFMTIFMMAYLFYESPVMTLCVLGLTLICVAVYFLVFRKRIRRAGKVTRKARIEMNKSVFQVFGGIKEIKVLHRETFFEKVFCKARDTFIENFVKFKAIDIMPKYTLEIICFGGAFILIGFFIYGGANLSAYISQLALFVMAAFRILPAITKQVHGINNVIFNRASVDAVYANMFEERDIAAVVSDYNKVTPQHHDQSCIEVCNVSFSYPKAETSVLENVSFTIPENKSVAFVGTTGAGKTTLADLILGILTPDSGTVLYKGQPIYNSDIWSNSVGYIPQQIYLLDESILANVAFGIEPEDIDTDKVHRALEQAQLRAFVDTLTDGVNTLIGDRGVRLSGGQRQRIGIARAIYEDPPILVLDEATSSLDNDTEAAVMEAILGFQGNKTMLIIAHRLSTIEHCDIVYRVENKTVIREK